MNYLKPKNIIYLSNILLPFFIFATICFLISGFYLGLLVSPSDGQQGENYRIIYIHVPSAWLSIGIYTIIVLFSLFYLIYKHPIAYLMAKTFSKLGILLTLVTLITGSLWGKPMWGTFWVWDARLTSVLILFFLYLAYYFLASLNNIKAMYFSSLFAIIGFINIPIIKYSVQWWHTLHQPSSISQLGTSIHFSMLIPLLFILIGFLSFSLFLFFLDLRKSLISQASSHWNG